MCRISPVPIVFHFIVVKFEHNLQIADHSVLNLIVAKPVELIEDSHFTVNVISCTCFCSCLFLLCKICNGCFLIEKLF